MTTQTIHFGVRPVGLDGWHTIWQGAIVIKKDDAIISVEAIGGHHLDSNIAVQEARDIYEARQIQMPRAA